VSDRFALAYPVAESHRNLFRRLIGPMPIIVPGSVEQPCTDCGLRLGVGPRVVAQLQADPGIVLLCPICLCERGAVPGAWDFVSLHNPDSRIETRRPT